MTRSAPEPVTRSLAFHATRMLGYLTHDDRINEDEVSLRVADLEWSRVSNSRSFTPDAKSRQCFLLSLIGSVQRESIVIVKKFELEILTNLHVVDLSESDKHNFGFISVCVCVSVCEHDNSKTIRARGMKFGM
ncbi:hypothetical protein AVEN_185267-1 [Araneus ventricosus]|uniref:Uncharacterized protein n=1 Tax=Araneus ventricosus TaxID=182803 RepID=A0A4Y1ZQW2_ARAVE|nr:hypothetical protein AVEN_185267-1 [Araneus ventricosus]